MSCSNTGKITVNEAFPLLLTAKIICADFSHYIHTFVTGNCYSGVSMRIKMLIIFQYGIHTICSFL